MMALFLDLQAYISVTAGEANKDKRWIFYVNQYGLDLSNFLINFFLRMGKPL